MDKALEAAVQATRHHSFNALTMDEHRDIVRAAITAYLAALPATDTSGLVERLRSRAAVRMSLKKPTLAALYDAELDRSAADRIEALERENAGLRIERDKWDRRVAYDELKAREQENRATQQRHLDEATARAEKAEARLAEAEALLGAFLNCEYESRRDLNDCIDNSGVPYQSQYLADRIADTERFLTPAPTSKGGSDGRS